MTATVEMPVFDTGLDDLVPGAPDLLILASMMLSYPDERLCAARADILSALADVPDSPVRGELVEFADWWAGMDEDMLRQMYVATFDTRRSSTLYMTYLSCGDTRERGQALLDFKQLYRSVGFVPTDDELPDFLPTICQFAALAPQDVALEAWKMARLGIDYVREALVKQASPYAHILAAIAMIVEKELEP